MQPCHLGQLGLRHTRGLSKLEWLLLRQLDVLGILRVTCRLCYTCRQSQESVRIRSWSIIFFYSFLGRSLSKSCLWLCHLWFLVLFFLPTSFFKILFNLNRLLIPSSIFDSSFFNLLLHLLSLKQTNKSTSLIISIELIKFLLRPFLILCGLLIDDHRLLFAIIAWHWVAIGEHYVILIFLLGVRFDFLVHCFCHLRNFVTWSYYLREGEHVVCRGRCYVVYLLFFLLLYITWDLD